MSGKKRVKKGIKSLEKQIELHKEKLAKAAKEGNIGLTGYYEKEIQNFERVKERLKRRIEPISKRKK
ncbi:MAG: hypothetical protein QMD85_05290 [Candidatus Aenigmarchaeota archaeon]|nr:hypothetical protein [Candidatus Aenigmarchaeota archaeon]